MTESKRRSGETLGMAFVGTFVSNDVEERAWVVITLGGVEVFRWKARHGVDWLGERSAIEEAFQEFAKEISMNMRAARNRSAR